MFYETAREFGRTHRLTHGKRSGPAGTFGTRSHCQPLTGHQLSLSTDYCTTYTG